MPIAVSTPRLLQIIFNPFRVVISTAALSYSYWTPSVSGKAYQNIITFHPGLKSGEIPANFILIISGDLSPRYTKPRYVPSLPPTLVGGCIKAQRSVVKQFNTNTSTQLPTFAVICSQIQRGYVRIDYLPQLQSPV